MRRFQKPKNVAIKVRSSDNVGESRAEVYIEGANNLTTTSGDFTARWSMKGTQKDSTASQSVVFDSAGSKGLFHYHCFPLSGGGPRIAVEQPEV